MNLEELRAWISERSTSAEPSKTWYSFKSKYKPFDSATVEDWRDGFKITLLSDPGPDRYVYARMYIKNHNGQDRTVFGFDEVTDYGELVNKYTNKPVTPSEGHPKRTTPPFITDDMGKEQRIEIFTERVARGECVTRWEEFPPSVKPGGYSFNEVYFGSKSLGSVLTRPSVMPPQVDAANEGDR